MWLPQGGARIYSLHSAVLYCYSLQCCVIVLNISAHNVDQKSLWQLHIQKTKDNKLTTTNSNESSTIHNTS